MSFYNGLPANFTISEGGKRGIELIRRQWDDNLPDKAAVVSVAWGLFSLNNGINYGSVFVSFYGQSQYDDIKHGIEDCSGIPILFFITEEFYHKFEGKVLDYADGFGFYLRDPAQSGPPSLDELARSNGNGAG